MIKLNYIRKITVFPCLEIQITRRNVKTGHSIQRIYKSHGYFYDARLRQAISKMPDDIDYMYNEEYYFKVR